MKQNFRCCVVFALFAALQLFGAAGANAAEIYIVYSAKEKARLAAVVEQIPAEWRAAPYDADLLAFADDGGRRNVTDKLMRADLVIFVDVNASRRFPPSLVTARTAVVLSEEDYRSEIAELVARFGSP